VIGRFTEDYPAGTPAVTVNRVGKGKAVYLGADLPQNALDELLGNLAQEAGAVPAAESDPGVEVSLRKSETAEYLFALNFNGRTAAFTLPGGGWTNAETGETLTGRIELAPRQCLAARRER
jgi:beta-galactosidase